MSVFGELHVLIITALTCWSQVGPPLLGVVSTASLLFNAGLLSCLSGLFLSYNLGLLYGLGHHFLLLVPLTDVIPVEADVTVLAKPQQVCLQEAAQGNGRYRNHQQ